MLRFPSKKMLVPFNFSEASMAAWKQAREWGRRFHASVEVVYVDEFPPLMEWEFRPFELTPGLKRNIVDHVRSKLGPEARVHVDQGDAAAIILRLARTSRADLIVMGTHGRDGFKRVWLGSVAESVVRQSPIPVFVVRREAGPIRSVLAPLNFTDYSEAGFFYAAGAAAALKARLVALHVASDPLKRPNPRINFAMLTEKLPPLVAKACQPRLEIGSGDPTEEILDASRGHGLVVIVAHRKSLLRDLVLGTTAERVLRHSRVPVLAVPAQKLGKPLSVAAFQKHPLPSLP